MVLDLMFTSGGAGDALAKCRQPRQEVMELISTLGEVDYGNTLDLLGVNIVLQDAGMVELRTRVSRKRREASVDVELSKQWVRSAGEAEIKLAILKCLTKAVGMVRERLTRGDDSFDAPGLIADLETLTAQVCADQAGLSQRVAGAVGQDQPESDADGVEDGRTLILQYRTEGRGSPGDMRRRHKIESLLDERLGATGNGYCDGGDIGSGTINIFLVVPDPQRAADVIVETLREARFLEGALIALEGDGAFEILWPRDFEGEFSYSY